MDPKWLSLKIYRKFIKNFELTSKTKKKLLRRKPSVSLAKFIIYKIVYVIIHFVIIIVSYLALIRLLFLELGFRQIKRKYILYYTITTALKAKQIKMEPTLWKISKKWEKGTLNMFAQTFNPQVKKQRYLNLVYSGRGNMYYRGSCNIDRFWGKK